MAHTFTLPEDSMMKLYWLRLLYLLLAAFILAFLNAWVSDNSRPDGAATATHSQVSAMQ
jgi:hypothetical protein